MAASLLDLACALCTAEGPRLLLVAGDHAVGKSALLASCVERATAAGCLVQRFDPLRAHQADAYSLRRAVASFLADALHAAGGIAAGAIAATRLLIAVDDLDALFPRPAGTRTAALGDAAVAAAQRRDGSASLAFASAAGGAGVGLGTALTDTAGALKRGASNADGAHVRARGGTLLVFGAAGRGTGASGVDDDDGAGEAVRLLASFLRAVAGDTGFCTSPACAGSHLHRHHHDASCPYAHIALAATATRPRGLHPLLRCRFARRAVPSSSNSDSGSVVVSIGIVPLRHPSRAEVAQLLAGRLQAAGLLAAPVTAGGTSDAVAPPVSVRLRLPTRFDVAALADAHCSAYTRGDAAAVAAETSALVAALVAALASAPQPGGVVPVVDVCRLLGRVLKGHVPVLVAGGDEAAIRAASGDAAGGSGGGGSGGGRAGASSAPERGASAMGAALASLQLQGVVEAADFHTPQHLRALLRPPAAASAETATDNEDVDEDEASGTGIPAAVGAGNGETREAGDHEDAANDDHDDDGDDDDDDAHGGLGGASSSSSSSSTFASPTDRPHVPWSAISGQEVAKKALHDALVWPMQVAAAHALATPAVAAGAGISTTMTPNPETSRAARALRRLPVPQCPTGILLYGPPGTGKTLLAKAAASAMGARFIDVSIPRILQAGVGDSERALATVFAAALAASPCVLFVDEIQAMFVSRASASASGGGDDASRMSAALTSQLLLSLDEVAAHNAALRQRVVQAAHSAGASTSSSQPSSVAGVVVLAATNVPEALDTSLLRPGRFDLLVHVHLPSTAERRAHLHTLLGPLAASGKLVMDTDAHGSSPTSGSGGGVDALASSMAAACDGFSGADMANVVRTAVMMHHHHHHQAAAAAVVCGVDAAAARSLAQPPPLPTSTLVAALASMTPSTPRTREGELVAWRAALSAARGVSALLPTP